MMSAKTGLGTSWDRARLVALSPVGSSFATSLLVLALTTVTGIVLARQLAPEGRGTLAAVLMLPGIVVMLGALGLGEAATVWAANNEIPAGTLTGTLLALASIQSIIMIPLGALAIVLLMNNYAPATKHLMIFYLVSYIPLTLVATYALAMLRGQTHYHHYNLARTLVFAVSTAVLPILAFAKQLTVATATITYVFASVVTLLLALYWTADCVDTPLRISRSLGKDLLRFGMRSYLGNITGMFNERLDQMVMAIFLNPAQLGLYVVAVTASSPVTMAGGSVAVPATPDAARGTSPGETRELATRHLGTTLALSSAIAIPLMIAAPWAITLVFGHDYAPAATAARILVLGAFFLSINRVLAALLTGLRQPLAASTGQLLSLVATAAGLALLLPRFGLTGAALTSVLAYLIADCYMMVRLAACLDLRTWSLLGMMLTQSLAAPRRIAWQLRAVFHRKRLSAE